MENLSSPKTLKEIIAKHRFRINKGLGQNFLIDINILNKIINSAELGDNTGVIEIGPGLGVLTCALSEKAKKIVAIEIDSNLIPILKETLKDCKNVDIINADVLKTDIPELINKHLGNMEVKVVANLPYYITTPVIMKLLEQKLKIESIVVMIQKEVAQRMVAKAGEKEYGALSVAIQYYTQARIITSVSPKCFIPQPNVESAVIKLDIRSTPIVNIKDENKFFNVVKASFGQRRKTIVNALYNSKKFEMSKEEIKEQIIKLKISEQQRGETLSITQFADISNTIF